MSYGWYWTSYGPMFTDGNMTSIPYRTSPCKQVQPTTPGTSPGMNLPTGIPTGPPLGGVPPTTTAPATPSELQVPQTVQNPYFLAGKLRSYIGKDVRVEFLMGTNGPLIDRIGTLLEVGASYIIIRPIRTDDTLVCDLFSIKFVNVYA